VQLGTAEEIYQKPANRFVADFIGTTNFIPGEAVEVHRDAGEAYVRTEFSEGILCKTGSIDSINQGEAVYASIRPEDVEIFTESPQDRGKGNLFKGTIAHKAYLGNFLYLFVSVNGTMIRVQVAYDVPQEEGQEIFLSLDPQKCMVLL
jgi:iron(III) transport system ATP-binding protein